MTLPLRQVVFWLHLTAGVVAGAVVLVMSVTGVLLAYEEQLVAWAERGAHAAAVPPGAERRTLATLVARAAATVPDAEPSAVLVEAESAAPVRVAFGRGRAVLVEPFTGRVLGEGAQDLRAALRTVTAWHRWLGQTDEGRDVGRAITGACNLAFLVLIVSGLYLWVPRRWNRRQVRNVAWFRGGLAAKARDFNWHNVLGLWSALPLLAVVASGVVISYPWAGDLVYRLVGEEPPAARGRGPERGRSGGGPPGGDAEAASDPAVRLAALDTAFAAAVGHAGGWRTITVELPEGGAETVAVSVARGGRGRPDLRERLVVDPRTARVVDTETFADQSRGRRVRSWLRWIHTGEAGGVAGQTIAAVASAAAVVLVWTGIALAWRRLIPRRRIRTTAPSGGRAADALGDP
ncbi:MAG TPA: PepSY-associated TM helix domain-containing protein [Thermoanaerobaculia bacterium]|nr:PepSY-associated TM helix domain-containing protein [Thermoanaerobaculia bacterium]